MQCPQCQFENPTENNFCGECSAKFERLCSGCNSSNPINFKSCGECGHNLMASKEISGKKSEAKNLEHADLYLPRYFQNRKKYL
ncbi:MAG: hypothetical protein GY850_00075 [bacterium]|nr:hypothetical protein [bacterium]